MPTTPVLLSQLSLSKRISARPRRYSRILLTLAVVLAAAALLAGGMWGVLAVVIGLPAAALGYALELRRLWTTAGRTGR